MTEDLRRDEHTDIVERIVREVLVRLDGNEEPTTDDVDHTDGRDGDKRQPTCRVLAERVITADVLLGKLNGIGEIRVERRAVVTPAARDVLRHAAVRVVRRDVVRHDVVRRDNGPPSVRPQTCRLVVGVAECRVEPAAAGQLADVHRGDIQHIARVGLVEVVKELSEHVVLSGSKGLLFTEVSAAAVCLANRNRGVRAVSGNGVDDVEKAIASVGANLLVVRPTGLTTWAQLQMVEAVVKSSAVCPSELAAALN